MSLSSVLRQILERWPYGRTLGNRREPAPSKLKLELAGETIEEIRRIGISKANNMTYVGTWRGRRVRVNQVASAEHAAFIKRIATSSPLAEYFPTHFLREGRHLVVEWIAGHPLTEADLKTSSDLLETLVHIQSSLHQLSFQTETSGFDYVEFLETRFHHYRDVWPLSDAFASILEALHDHQPPSEVSRLSHPDITPSNIVRRRESGQLVLVDNELLNESHYYLIDLFNTYYNLADAHLRSRYLNLYRHFGSDLHLASDWMTPLVALWGLRLAGSYFQAGEFDKAYRTAEEVVAGKIDSHPVVRILQEKSL